MTPQLIQFMSNVVRYASDGVRCASELNSLSPDRTKLHRMFKMFIKKISESRVYETVLITMCHKHKPAEFVVVRKC